MLNGIKKMRLINKVLLIILLVFVVAIVFLGVWQRDNIRAVVKTFSSSNEKIAEELNDNKKKLEEKIKEDIAVVVGDFTAEEERKIMEGTLSVEEAVSNLNKKYEEAKEKEQAKAEMEGSATTPENSSNSEKRQETLKKENLVGDKIVELYSLKAYYLGQLGQIEAAVKRDYYALPEAKRNLLGKQALVSKYIGKANSLLNQCDSQVNALLASLEKELREIGEDVSIIKTIRESYENEKSLKKAYYLSLMN